MHEVNLVSKHIFLASAEELTNELYVTKIMIETETSVIDPALTPGLVHADKLTHESAKTTEELLKYNNEYFHIFFTMEDHMGVRFHNPFPLPVEIIC